MKNSKTNIEFRQNAILRFLQKNENASVSDLSQRFSTTVSTIRRDLEYLEQKGYVRRYFGGAQYVLPPNTDVQYRTPKGNPTPSRIAVARKAAEMVSDGDIVFLNSSSTALYILDYLPDIKASVLTNNARAIYSRPHSGIELILTGGEVYGNKQSLVGIFAVEAVHKMVANICFLGASGISSSWGITSSIIQEVPVNQEMLHQCSGYKVVVADSTKIGVRQNFFSVGLSNITHLITDSYANPEELDRIRDRGVEVIIANPD